MKYFITLFALIAVSSANPLPLVQIIVNIDVTENAIGAAPAVIGESPAFADMPIVDFVPEEEASYDPLPLPMPQPTPIVVVDGEDASYNPLPLPMPQPTPIVVPEPVVLPQPVLPEPVIVAPEPIVIPEPIMLPETESASIPISPIVNQPTPIEV